MAELHVTVQVCGIDQLWGIALRAQNTDVSLNAIQCLNNHYINCEWSMIILLTFTPPQVFEVTYYLHMFAMIIRQRYKSWFQLVHFNPVLPFNSICGSGSS